MIRQSGPVRVRNSTPRSSVTTAEISNFKFRMAENLQVGLSPRRYGINVTLRYVMGVRGGTRGYEGENCIRIPHHVLIDIQRKFRIRAKTWEELVVA